MSRICYDPGLQFDDQTKPKSNGYVAFIPVRGSNNRERVSVRTNKTEFLAKQGKDLSQVCLIYLNSQTPHSLKGLSCIQIKGASRHQANVEERRNLFSVL